MQPPVTDWVGRGLRLMSIVGIRGSSLLLQAMKKLKITEMERLSLEDFRRDEEAPHRRRPR